MQHSGTPARYGIWVALLLLALTGLLAVHSLTPPAPLPLDAAPERFSGTRAADTLAFLLGDQTPHPVGSAANRAVRDRLIETLKGLGLTPEVQRTVGCSARWPICANVENVVAEIPGRTSDALVLMAHYDSVPHSPGAADDGSGVVTLLESARALVREPPRQQRIILVFTDAEEMGLLGAEAFFGEHRWAADVRAVINVEGSGSGGPSLLLRSSNPGGHLLEAYRQTASAANAYSYSQEVFARMPNDTDFTVPDRQGISSIDFAFAFEFNHYHTPLDTIENLDPGTLQHHGDNVLPLARRLADADLASTGASFSYLTLAQRLWITWPVGWTLALAVSAVLGLLVVAFRLRDRVPLKEVPGGLLLAILAVVLGGIFCFGLLWLAGKLAGTVVAFPASPWPWRLLMIAGALLPVFALSAWANGRIGPWARYLGVWLVLSASGVALAAAAPLAANLLVVPALCAAILAGVAVVFFDPGRTDLPVGLTLLSLLPLAYILITIAWAMEETQGYLLAPAIYAYLVLVALALLPLAVNRIGIGGAAGAALIGLAAVAVLPLYSDWRPQHLSLFYLLDRDTGQARIAAQSVNPLPEAVRTALTRTAGEPASEQPIVPWVSDSAFSAPAAADALPDFEVDLSRDGSRVRIVLTDRGSGDHAQLVLPASAAVTGFRMAGRAMDPHERDGYLQARFFANGNEPLVFEFDTGAMEIQEAYLVAGSHRLPPAAAAVSRARGTLAVPRHQGDQQLTYRRVRF